MNTQHLIKNFDEIATTPLRTDALMILEAGYDAILTKKAIHRVVEKKFGGIRIVDKEFSFTEFDRVFVVAIGKCAVDAGLALEDILRGVITAGIVLDIKQGDFQKLESFVGTHPYPSAQNVGAVKEIVEMISGLTERDLVITVISGGGSSLLSLPYKISTDDLTNITREIMSQSAPIHELNIVRKHLSEIQGGFFAKSAYPAKVVSLIFSDVPGNDLTTIASGPTVFDESTKDEADAILANYDILKKCNLPDLETIETPKDEKYFANVENFLVVTNCIALQAMKQKATELGYTATIESDHVQGIARYFGEELARKTLAPKTCLLYGGEMTVHVAEHHGVGGRNQELVLGGLAYLPQNTVLVGASSDGKDFSDAGGAIGDSALFEKGEALGLHSKDFLVNNNAFEFFQKSGGHIHTGSTGANIADLYFVMRGE